MHDSRINYVVVGAFVAVMLAAFVVVISMLAGRTGSSDEYYTVYGNVSGLKFGTIVLYEGYQVGQVESIEPTSAGGKIAFRVNMSVEEGWNIPEDSVARATVSGLLSAMTIDIAAGASTTMLQPGSEIRGLAPSNIFATLAELGAEFGELSDSTIRPLLQNLNAFIVKVDKTTMDSLPKLLADLQVLSGSLATDVPEISNSMKRSLAAVEQGVLSQENIAKIDTILSDIAGFTGQLDETRAALNEATESVNKIIQDNAGNVDESIRSLRYTLDTISRYVDSIAQNAEATTRNFAEFSRALRENPGLLIRGSPQDSAPQAGE